MEPAHVPDRLITKIVLSAALAAACVGLGLRTLGHEPHRYFIVNELAATGLDDFAGTDLRVRGFVVPGTIRELDAYPGTHQFLLAYRGVALRVEVPGVLPDTFRDQSEVVVDGRLTQRHGAWVIDADKLLTKCGGKYEGNTPPLTATRFQ